MVVSSCSLSLELETVEVVEFSIELLSEPFIGFLPFLLHGGLLRLDLGFHDFDLDLFASAPTQRRHMLLFCRCHLEMKALRRLF